VHTPGMYHEVGRRIYFNQRTFHRVDRSPILRDQ
jgi:hypothetical protein